MRKKLTSKEEINRLFDKGYHIVHNTGAEYKNHSLMKRNRIAKLKEAGGRCEICNEPAKSIHHIDETKHNHEPFNLIVVCKACHCVLHSDGCSSGPNSKFTRKYGMNLKEMAIRLDLSPSTVYTYLSNPKKRNIILGKLGINIQPL